ncbi:hypothetical protein Y1Q_0005484 [Alligator mississippiensis]|uniref:Uncharacterized protein n=1 Tax=Alligator mississippiensis TaxID=8496 RepID=A0A151MES4_ALLMI|nr:hypothetical protein Y1Q_0005484 [Alligator mississippiensis]
MRLEAKTGAQQLLGLPSPPGIRPLQGFLPATPVASGPGQTAWITAKSPSCPGALGNLLVDKKLRLPRIHGFPGLGHSFLQGNFTFDTATIFLLRSSCSIYLLFYSPPLHSLCSSPPCHWAVAANVVPLALLL